MKFIVLLKKFRSIWWFFFSWKDAPTLVHRGSCIKSLRLDVGSISIWLSYWLWIASVIDLLCIITVFFMIILLFSNCWSVDWLLSVNGGVCVCYDCIHVCNNYYWLDNFYKCMFVAKIKGFSVAIKAIAHCPPKPQCAICDNKLCIQYILCIESLRVCHLW